MTISKKKKAQKGACRYSASTKLRLRLLARILPPLALLCLLVRVFPPCHTTEYDHIRPLLACTANGFLQRKMFLQPVSSNRRTAVLLLLLLAGDIARNPGPPVANDSMFPCAVCDQHVSWDT